MLFTRLIILKNNSSFFTLRGFKQCTINHLPIILILSFFNYRLEKEKSQLKGELDDVRSSVDHVNKEKVSNII